MAAGTDATCTGTAEQCKDKVVCDTSNGYGGFATVTCPENGGYFMLSGCYRGLALSGGGDVYYKRSKRHCISKSPFSTLGPTPKFTAETCAGFCQVKKTSDGCIGFEMGNHLCDPTDNQCVDANRCYLLSTGACDAMVPYTATDLYIDYTKISATAQLGDFGDSFKCFTTKTSGCCKGKIDAVLTASIKTTYSTLTGAEVTIDSAKWIDCKGKADGTHGCSEVMCAHWCKEKGSACTSFFREPYDGNSNGFANPISDPGDYYVCAFSTTCDGTGSTRTGCTAGFHTVPANCDTVSTIDCSKCTECKTGFVEDEGECKKECGDGKYKDSNDVCQHCIAYCQSCDTAGPSCDVNAVPGCQDTPRKYYLTPNQASCSTCTCVYPCTLPTDFGSKIIGKSLDGSTPACTVGALMATSSSCGVACEDGYVTTATLGTNKYSCNSGGSALTKATLACELCSGVIDKCTLCASRTECTTCESGYQPNTDASKCEDIDDCLSKPCVHGTCKDDGVNKFACTCESGWEGTTCDSDIDDCKSPNQCDNPFAENVCTDLGTNKFSCTCLNGWTGETCYNEPRCIGFSDPGTTSSPSCVCDGPNRYAYACCFDNLSPNTIGQPCVGNHASTSATCTKYTSAGSTCTTFTEALAFNHTVCRVDGCADVAGGGNFKGELLFIRERRSELTAFETVAYIGFKMPTPSSAYFTNATLTLHVSNKLTDNTCGELFVAKVDRGYDSADGSTVPAYDVTTSLLMSIGNTCPALAGPTVDLSFDVDITTIVNAFMTSTDHYSHFVLQLSMEQGRNVGAAFTTTGTKAPTLTLVSNNLDKARMCYAPGYTTSDCQGLANDCEGAVTCDTANGWSGAATLSCTGDHGYFRLDGCARLKAVDPAVTVATGAAGTFLPRPFSACQATASATHTKQTPDKCAALCVTAKTCGAFNMGNGACDAATGTCTPADTCLLLPKNGCDAKIAPRADMDFFWLMDDIPVTNQDLGFFGSLYSCWGSNPGKCCIPDLDLLTTITTKFPTIAGQPCKACTPPNIFISCGAEDAGTGDGCDLFTCLYMCENTAGCGLVDYGQQTITVCARADVYICISAYLYVYMCMCIQIYLAYPYVCKCILYRSVLQPGKFILVVS